MPPWQRKESVTIIERAEDEKAAEDEPDKPDRPETQVKPEPEVVCPVTFRRASSAGEHSEDQFLTVPKSMTASSSAETLSGEVVYREGFKLGSLRYESPTMP